MDKKAKVWSLAMRLFRDKKYEALRKDLAYFKTKLDYLVGKVDSLSYQLGKTVKHGDFNALLQIKESHAQFLPYKEAFEGRDIVIFATGPTLNKYKPIANAINIGVNRSFMYNKVEMDYYFLNDYENTRDYILKLAEYLPNKCEKFFGQILDYVWGVIPDEIYDLVNAKRFFVGSVPYPFYQDISKYPFPEFGAITFSALAFAIYTKPRRLFIAGCDETPDGYFTGDKMKEHTLKGYDGSKRIHMRGWNEFKKFASIYYPKTEIISINPIGLKGLFKDIYTDKSGSYVDSKGNKINV